MNLTPHMMFGYHYNVNGKLYGFTVEASCKEEADARVAAMHTAVCLEELRPETRENPATIAI